MKAVRAVALVGDQGRHRWYAALLADHSGIDLRGVVTEQQPPRPRGTSAGEVELVSGHFVLRDEAEARHLSFLRDWDEIGAPVLAVARNETNSERVARWVQEREPDVLLLYGCGIVRPPLLDVYTDRTINLHLGLSPYYRGDATNFWPLVNGEPECVGATVHLATLDVDAGPILRQVRPPVQPTDDSHDLGCKALVAGAGALLDAMPAYAAGRLRPVPQPDGGRLYRRADFDAAPGRAITELHRRFASGMIPAYLARKAERDARFPIVE